MREPRNRFQEFIREHGEDSKELPLVHTTAAYSFADLCGHSEISPEQCIHFQKKLIYLFYGRPAYRTQESESSNSEFNWPIVFIFDPGAIDGIVSVFPIDTGAFYLNLYQKFFHKDTIIEDLRLPGKIECARKIVGTFYGSSEQYISGKSKKNVEIATMQYEAIGVNRLTQSPPYTSGGEPIRDERSATVEVQTSNPIDIAASTIGIIMPQSYLLEPEVVDALKRWDIPEVMTYEIFGYHNPGGWIDQIYALAKKFYISKGFLIEL